MTCKHSFRVTETVAESLREGDVDHEMIEALVEYSLSDDVRRVDVDGVRLSMTGRDEDVLRTGVVVADDEEYGFQVSRKMENGEDMKIIIEVAKLEWAI